MSRAVWLSANARWPPTGAPPGRRCRKPQPEADGPRAWPIAKARTLAWPPPSGADEPKARRRRGFAARLGDAFSLFLMILGSITFALLVGIGAYLAWTTRLRDLWTLWIGAPPF
jgi:hypothetical protein